MTHYACACMDAAGKTHQASLDAENEADLKAVLQEKGLFLISCHSQQPSPTTVSLITDADKRSRWDMTYDGVVAFFSQPKGVALLLIVSILAMGVSIDSFFPPIAEVNRLHHQVAEIHAGDTRQDLERLMKQRDLRQPSPQKTRYLSGQGWILEVTYDLTGGPNSPSNKIIAILEVPVASH